ncbi:LamG-like jellyroll fold domain-containing protein [Thermococcus sp.]|uniref:LamG-like jellyroll fold domain-containing protein n=1 Tax=Thermococcus sp. TaxID=35749 RepID=UPI002635C7C5|nr:LamG-like jellyroll fold domain-containing protein [Thermococcus sp.]
MLEYLPSSVDPATNTWVDESGNGNDGQINGATYVPLRPVSEFSESYALNFNRTDYVTSSLQSLENGLTVIQFVKLNSWGTGDGGNLFSRGGNLGYRYRTLSSNGRLWVLINNGTAFHVWAASQVVELHREVMVGFSVAPYDTVEMIYNGKVVFSTSYPYAISNTTAVAYIGALSPTAELIDGEVYVTLIYARKLSDQEIQQIYENPNNPPLDGLVLWYSPYSYDPSTGKWLNRAPIFPTIPLVEELDGVNYGATPERVSIPSTGYYDASNSSPISPLDVSVSLIENNTTISLIPSFLTLPYNETVTLNVSATGYESRTLSILTTINSLAVYLEPANKTSEYQNVLNVLNQTNLVKNLTANFTITPINPYAKAILDSGGSFGKTVELAIRGDDLVKLIMPQLFTFAFVILVLFKTDSPLAALGSALIMWAMWTAVIGEAPNLRNSGVTFTLVVFLVAWTLWDLFYNYSRET